MVLLAAFNESISGIPFAIGFVLASVLALAIVVVADRRAFAGEQAFGPFLRAVGIWVATFVLLALLVSRSDGTAILIVPFLGATIAALGYELARRARTGHR